MKRSLYKGLLELCKIVGINALSLSHMRKGIIAEGQTNIMTDFFNVMEKAREIT